MQSSTRTLSSYRVFRTWTSTPMVCPTRAVVGTVIRTMATSWVRTWITCAADAVRPSGVRTVNLTV